MACEHFKRDLGKILNLDLRNILFPYRTTFGAVVIAENRLLVCVSHGKNLFRMRGGLLTLDLFYPVSRYKFHELGCLFPRKACFFAACLIDVFVFFISYSIIEQGQRGVNNSLTCIFSTTTPKGVVMEKM